MSRPKQASEAVPFTDKPLHATEKLAAFLICAWVQIKKASGLVELQGFQNGCLTTVEKPHQYLLIIWDETNAFSTFSVSVLSIHKAY